MLTLFVNVHVDIYVITINAYFLFIYILCHVMVCANWKDNLMTNRATYMFFIIVN